MKSLASAEVLSETRERLRSLRADDRARWGRMTVTQMVLHMGQSYEVALGERVVGPMKGIPPVVMKWAALRSGFRWPQNVETTPELKRAMGEETEGGFAELVGAAVSKMEALASGAGCASDHPMFGRMTVKDWMRWGYLHADHHLRQFGR